MDGIKRKLLYLKPRGREAVLQDEICDAGWEVSTVERQDEARRQIATRKFHVGLALLDRPGDWELLDGASIKLGSAMEWIALVAPDLMRLASVGHKIRANFFDYHTLPVDSPRLLLALGHAYGMATLANKLMLTSWQGSKAKPVQSLQRARRQAEQEAIEQALRRTDNNVTRAASELGISRVTLYRLLDKSRSADGR